MTQYIPLTENNMGLSHCKAIEYMGQGYNDILSYTHSLMIEDSAKDTKKTFNSIIRYYMLMSNIKGLNCLITRNTVALLNRSTIRSFWKVRNFLINKGLNEFSIIKDSTLGNDKKWAVWPDGRKVIFMAFENEISGTDVDNGFLGRWLVEEPMERNVSRNFSYDEQHNKFKELCDTSFRGIPQGKIKWPCCNIEENFEFQINMLFNDWDEEHWINTEYVSKIHPWTKEYEEWILSDPLKNFKSIKEDINFPITKGKGLIVIRTTKFINEFRDKRDDEKLLYFLKTGDPFYRTSIIGAPYDSSDPSIFMWRKMMEYKQKYKKEDFLIDKEKVIGFGFDGGKNDNNVLSIGYLKKIDNKFRLYIPYCPSYKIDGKKRNELNKLGVAKLIYEWFIQELKNNNINKEWKIGFSYDDHEEITANCFEEWVQEKEWKNTQFIPAVKNGWYSIEIREKIINYLYLTDQIIINWEDNPLLEKEYWKQQYIIDNSGTKKRDEIHFSIDFQNSIEYLVQIFLDWFELPDNI